MRIKSKSTKKRGGVLSRKSRNTRRRTRGGHPNQSLPHYHLYIKLPYGKIREVPEKFKYTELGEHGEKVHSGTVQDLIEFVHDDIGDTYGEFTLYWRGRKLDPKTKLRRIRVGTGKNNALPLFRPNAYDPIIVWPESVIPSYIPLPADVAEDESRPTTPEPSPKYV